MTKLLPTSLVGSYAQPDWLIDRAKLAARFPPRVRAKELWRVAPEFLKQAQDDATLLAIRDQERAGLDIITDGEIPRSKAWISIIREPRSIAPATQIRCRA
jgi:5-methyltetrahydropteroyltriglutamate--homocysteine methyltransferase